MYVPFETLGEPGDEVDVCLIGGGAAGVAMAVKLARQGHRVLLCEGGDQTFSERSQALYEGEVQGNAYPALKDTRLRYLGGSTNHWGGISRPLDHYDFAAKPAAPDTAWPIAREALDPYYDEAAGILELQPISPDQEIAGASLKRIHFSRGNPVRVSQKYAAELSDSPTLRCCLAANLFGLETHRGTVTSAAFKSYQGVLRRVRARYFVLACGGIENSRLLLWCNRQTQGRLIPQPAALGRYWMEHPHATVGHALILNPAPLDLVDHFNIFLSPTAEAIAERGILNCGLRLHRMSDVVTQQLIDELASVAPSLARRFNTLNSQKGGIYSLLLRAAWEQEPRRENRIELTREVDSLGMPRARLVWHQSALDVRTIRDSALLFGDYLRHHDIGRLQLADWLTTAPIHPPVEGELAGRHHMGGTRMSHSPDHGIVDSDCRVFAQDNLYIAGSSVFPSVGHANPTLTLVQLAIRLTAHLEGRLGQQAAHLNPTILP
ncbi:GMC family oxidoreductase [Halomonas sp. TRM85114]|uniref:FAD-dependent oxidoreductase n=1 Tax=Halomonas jincaotanensis TaxID=2810616 RepID=UPI001BD66828|nr:FAD-dependent oxidoreductase [Halomonas jincaotanensis]MBS9404768.1 GMC family oxidoreductase [Halomonas jincaotanensis]